MFDRCEIQSVLSFICDIPFHHQHVSTVCLSQVIEKMPHSDHYVLLLLLGCRLLSDGQDPHMIFVKSAFVCITLLTCFVTMYLWSVYLNLHLWDPNTMKGVTVHFAFH